MIERYRLVFSGSGGQGVITAAIILAESAVVHEKRNAVQTQVYGAAARGGGTRSDVIISDVPINYPKVDQPNVLVCLTQTAYNAYSGIIRPGGMLLTDPRFVELHRKADAVQHEVPMYENIMEHIGKPIVFNICMLGAVIGLTGIVKVESVLETLTTRIPKNFLGMNQEALEMGLALTTDLMSSVPLKKRA